MLNIKQESSNLVKVVTDLIGYQLSTMPAAGGSTRPSVIKARNSAPKPPFPYATVDHTGLRKVGYSQSSNYLDENSDEVDEFDYIGSFTVQVNGGFDHDVIGICEELRSRLFTSKGKRAIATYFPLSRLLKTSDIVFFPAILETDYEEAARVTIEFWMRSVIVDETTDVIDNISLDGELYEDYDQVEPPLTINTIAP